MSLHSNAVLSHALEHPDLQRLAARLRARAAVQAPVDAAARLAAVVAVLRVRAHPELLFIKRAIAEGDPWSGHMAFPGGRHDAGDASLSVTAVRETHEETAIHLEDDGQLLGELDDLGPRTPSLPRIVIRPFVAVVRADIQVVGNYEVADHFWVPLHELVANGADVEHVLQIGAVRQRFRGYRIGPHVAWGLTERIVSQLLELIPPHFE